MTRNRGKWLENYILGKIEAYKTLRFPLFLYENVNLTTETGVIKLKITYFQYFTQIAAIEVILEPWIQYPLEPTNFEPF